MVGNSAREERCGLAGYCITPHISRPKTAQRFFGRLDVIVMP